MGKDLLKHIHHQFLHALRVVLCAEASYILYELAGEAISTMTLTHDWEWHLGENIQPPKLNE